MSSSPRFARVYLESRAERYPATSHILDQLPGVPVIHVDDYRDLFFRPGQNFVIQKRAPAIILAAKRGEFLYRGNERIDSWSEADSYYNDLVRNCLFNCEYCFLQGMHASAHTLVFVNFEDFFDAAREMAAERCREIGASVATPGPCMHLSISYLTDLLGFEPLVPFASRWLAEAGKLPRVEIELRTKSDNYPLLRRVGPSPNVVLTWSLTPEPYANRFERGTASFRNRLFAAESALREGFRVRFCFDPVLIPAGESGWQQEYEACVAATFSRLPGDAIERVSIGALRMSGKQLSRVRREHPASGILNVGLEVKNGSASYAPDRLAEVQQFMVSTVSRYLSSDKVTFVHG